MTKAYILAQANISDAQQYEVYKRLAQVAVEKWGGRYIVRGGAARVLEGEWQPPRLVILEFDSADKAEAFYHSQEYQAARQARQGAAQMTMLLVEGM